MKRSLLAASILFSSFLLGGCQFFTEPSTQEDALPVVGNDAQFENHDLELGSATDGLNPDLLAPAEDARLEGSPAPDSEQSNSAADQSLPTQVDKTKDNMPKALATAATLETSKGHIQFELFPDVAPQTVENFMQKAESGFYEGLIFHRVEDWVVQGGDPKGNGTGGGKMPTELSERPFGRGSLGVARGADIRVSNDAQFFVCKSDCSFLTGQYTIFGQVSEGMEIIDSIAIGDQIVSLQTD